MPRAGDSPYTVNGSVLQFKSKHPDLGITIENSLKFHEHVRAKTNSAGALTSNLLSSTLCRDPEFLISLYISYIRPMLEYGSPLWNLGYVGDTQMVERIQRRWTREVTSVAHLSYEERLQALNLYSMRGRLLRADLIYVWKIFNGKCALKPSDLFQLSLSQQTRGHPLKLQVPGTQRETRRRFFSCRVIEEWNALSSEAVTAPSINMFKSLLHRDLGAKLFQPFKLFFSLSVLSQQHKLQLLTPNLNMQQCYFL